MSRQLTELLFKDKVITASQFTEAMEVAKQGKSCIRFLIEKKYLGDNQLLLYLSQKYGLPSVNISKFEINPEVIKLVPGELARKCQIIPVQSSKGTLVVATCDPTSLASLESLKFVTKMNVEAVLTSVSAFDAAAQKYYAGVAALGAAIDSYQKGNVASAEGEASLELVQIHDIDTGSSEQDAPVIQLVNGILTEAIRRLASDIHVEPYEKRMRVRMRIDGNLAEIAKIPLEMKRAVVARLKVMSRMDIGESRIPQDGRLKLKLAGQEVDFRVNTIPTLFGEKVVMRSLNKNSLQLDLKKLGFESTQLAVFQKAIYAPSGMILVTGPTGSGKTTTLYSALSDLNKVTDNISTVEDPVEYNLEGINQVQVHKEIGLTFASVLRSLLRQDPDIVLVGEIRDFETAEVAIQAALTGHLVLSTLHTNDAISTITRLVNMGIEPFLVVAALNNIVAQRLIRTICAACKTEAVYPPEKLIEVGLALPGGPLPNVYKGKGCSRCDQRGYKGRIAIYEVLDFSQALKEMVLRGETAIELRKRAVKDGMKSLRISALGKVTEGLTTLEEALSLTMED